MNYNKEFQKQEDDRVWDEVIKEIKKAGFGVVEGKEAVEAKIQELGHMGSGHTTETHPRGSN